MTGEEKDDAQRCTLVEPNVWQLNIFVQNWETFASTREVAGKEANFWNYTIVDIVSSETLLQLVLSQS